MLNALAFAAAAGETTKNPLIPEIYDIVWSIIPFVIILFLFWKVVLPAMRKTLDARAELIEGGIKKAENAQAEADAALEEYKKQLAEARAEAARIREQARIDGTAIITELKEQATVEAARVTASAKAQIEAERQSAIISLRSEVGTLAIDLASGVIGESLSDDKKASAVVDRFLAELESSEKVKAGK
ncbi:MAG: synthase subunit [Microbacteriaceae bacterium]|jgi:F-type H+-transporting ATPase subunit b|nr:synthase subunit [Microbacteriaceae bacterium]